MRVVYGAGAVAAMSVMAVGLVQPDFAATADQPADSAADVAWVDPTANATDPNQPANNRPVADVQVRHVIRYVHLRPGQTAPPGATVIQPDAPAPRVVVTRTRPAVQPPPRGSTANQPAPQPPAPRATRPPAPNPPPPVRTRQSGRRP